ncbi:hypothetical protein CEXT_393691 [Caerostris extrusa]|uniref:Uncharacterized protein n=1 Tax=Caerostris extrusa TaxID=172846 RepID=A0AAV4TAA3_CAEEX|nr:hypothetical protein CEXT_393691 [Caerostris extrusa]
MPTVEGCWQVVSARERTPLRNISDLSSPLSRPEVDGRPLQVTGCHQRVIRPSPSAIPFPRDSGASRDLRR